MVSSDLSGSTYMLCLQIEQPAGSTPITASAAFDVGTLFDKTGLLLGTAVNDQLRKLLLRGQRSKKDN